MPWVRMKGERKFHAERPISDEERALIVTGCGNAYGTNRVAARYGSIPPIKDRCRGCDSYRTQNQMLFDEANGAVLPEEGE